MLATPPPYDDMADWSSNRLREWANSLDTSRAPREINWWLSARWTPQRRACDRALDAESRREWAEGFLTLVNCMQRFTTYDRWSASADQFNMRALLIGQLGEVDGNTTWSADALVRDLLAALTLTPREAREQSRTWRSLPTDQILTLRRHKTLLAPLETIVGLLSRSADKDSVRDWLTVRPALP
ncbi:hypothetical protein [Rugosimonospora africana]|nr:hypothetical protein [Rugosimonospora africana]